MKKTVLLILLGSIVPHFLFSQNEIDALRYSNIAPTGTARSLGMGGAFGAIGADHSAFLNNPAGLAVYKRTTAELSLNFFDRATSASFLGTETSDSKFRTQVQSLGIAGYREYEKIKDWSFVYGIGFGLLSNYHQNLIIEGSNQNNTMLESFANIANGVPYDQVFDTYQFGAGLAWETFLIDPLDSTSFTYMPAEDVGRIDQQRSIQRIGRHSETTFAASGNYKDKIYVGATLGIQSVFFRESSVYTERFLDSDYLTSFTFTEDINANGNGISFRIGAIYRPTEWLRVGAAFHAPVNIQISDSYSTTMDSRFALGSNYSALSPELITNYRVRVPGRIQLNSAFILGKFGVVSADYETTSFNNIQMDGVGLSSGYDYTFENKTIETVYRRIHRAKIGLEARFSDVWRARAGFIYQTSPFNSGFALNESMMSYTSGLGYRKGIFSVDLAGIYFNTRESYWLYDPSLVEESRLTTDVIQILLSIGFRF